MLIHNSSTDLDDLSTHRASAYLSQSGSEPVREKLSDHLEEHKSELNAIVYNRYRARLDLYDSYFLSNHLIRFIEKLHFERTFQSVLITTLFTHGIPVIALFVLAGRIDPALSLTVRLSLIASAVAAFILFSHRHILPFQTQPLIWTNMAPRSSAFICVAAAALSLMTIKSAVSKTLVSGALIGLALMLHHMMAILLLVAITVPIIFYRLTEWTPARLFRTLGPRPMLMIYVVCCLVFPMIVYVMCELTGNPLSIRSQDVVHFLYWLLASVAILWIWFPARPQSNASEEENPGEPLLEWAVNLFIPLSILPLGACLVQSRNSPFLWNDFYLFYEASQRLTYFPHLLWWVIAGLLIHRQINHSNEDHPSVPRISTFVFFAVVSLTPYSFFIFAKDLPERMRILRNTALSQPRIFELIEKRGAEVYNNEKIYFQSVANEIRHRSLTSGSVTTE